MRKNMPWIGCILLFVSGLAKIIWNLHRNPLVELFDPLSVGLVAASGILFFYLLTR